MTIEQSRQALVELLEKAAWSKQPRVPAGSPKGGQFTSGGGFGGGGFGKTPEGGALKAPQLGIKTGGGTTGAMTVDSANFIDAETMASHKAKPMAPTTDNYDLPEWLGNENGIVNLTPVRPTRVEDNDNPEDIASFSPEADPGSGLNGIPFKPWDAPDDFRGVEGQGNFEEPPFPDAGKKRLGAGVIIEEPDGRVWVVEPTNHFGGYKATLPKGGQEPGLNLRETAIKEAWEESGLKVELTGVVGDYERTTSVARYYSAKRVGGDPTDHHWETSGMHLIPKEVLPEYMTHYADGPILADILADDVAKGSATSFARLLDMLPDVEKAFTPSGGKWKSKLQLRVPKGSGPKSGEWTVYGSGGWGGALALGDAPFSAQLIPAASNNKNMAYIDKLNAQAKVIEKEANSLKLSQETISLAIGPPPKQTYKVKAYQTAVEAVAYVKTKTAGAGAPHKRNPQTTTQIKPQVQTKPSPKAPTPVFKQGKGTLGDPINISALKKTGPKPGGSSTGYMATDIDGQQYLVKTYKASPDPNTMVMNEVAASALYNQMGVATPEMKIGFIDNPDGTADLAVVSKWQPNLETFDKSNPIHVKAMQEEFAMHAVMANWDAVGQSYDNVKFDPMSGIPVMIDPGGAMLMKATGGYKGSKFGTKVVEFETMRDSGVNPTAAAVFGPMTKSEMVASMKHVEVMLTPDSIDSVLKSYMGQDGDSLANVMKQRLEDVKAKIKGFESESAALKNADLETTGTNKPDIAAVAAGTPAALKSTEALDMVIQGSKQKITSVVDKFKKEAAAQDLSTAKGKQEAKAKNFYAKKVQDLDKFANAGDVDGLMAAKYAPKHGKLTTNYSGYLEGYDAMMAKAQAVKAKQLKAGAAEDVKGDGGLITGAIHPKDAPNPPDQPDNVVQVKFGNADADLTPPPALPDKPTFTSGAPKTVTSAADGIEKAAADGNLAAVMGIKASVKEVGPKGNGHYVKFHKYADNVIASMGGGTAYDNIPKAEKLKGVEAGIKSHVEAVKAIDAPEGKAAAGKFKVGQMMPEHGGRLTQIDDLGQGLIVGKVKVETQFDPRTLQPPLDFFNWPDETGKGPNKKWLSQFEAQNAENTANAKALYEAAKTGDLAALKAIEPSGSKHTKAYKAQLVAELEAVGTSKEKTIVLAGADNAKGRMAQAATIQAPKLHEPSIQKLAGYMSLGESPLIDADVDVLIPKKFNLFENQKVMQDLYDQSWASVKKHGAKKAVTDYTGSAAWPWNEYLRGIGSESYATSATNAARKVQKAAIPLPAGMVLHRGMHENAAAGLTLANMEKASGKILVDQGIISTKMDHKASFAGNAGIQVRFTVAEGAKGIYVDKPPDGHGGYGYGETISQNSGPNERELVLPPNTKMFVRKVLTAEEANKLYPGYNYKKPVVDVLVLPHDDVEI